MTVPPDDQLMRDAEELHEALNQLVRVYQFRDRDRICCYDVSVTQSYAVETLVRKGPMRMQALADELFLDKSTESRVINALERKSYVIRLAESVDRRAVNLQATDAGRTLCENIRRDLIAEEKLMLDGLPPAIRQGAIAMLKQITLATEKRYGIESDCCT